VILGSAPNSSFKPNLLRSTNHLAARACHAVGSATQVGLTQAMESDSMPPLPEIGRRYKHAIALLLFVLIAGPFLFFLVFGLPIVGNLVVLDVAADLGCTVNASKPHPCFLWGKDIGPVVYDYAVGSLLGGIFNFIHAFGIIKLFMPLGVLFWIVQLWMVLVSFLTALRILGNEASRVHANG
jgi:hypothetical protein